MTSRKNLTEEQKAKEYEWSRNAMRKKRAREKAVLLGQTPEEAEAIAVAKAKADAKAHAKANAQPEMQTHFIEELDPKVRREIARRVLARRSLIEFTKRFLPLYDPGWVHHDIARRLEKFKEDV